MLMVSMSMCQINNICTMNRPSCLHLPPVTQLQIVNNNFSFQRQVLSRGCCSYAKLQINQGALNNMNTNMIISNHQSSKTNWKQEKLIEAWQRERSKEKIQKIVTPEEENKLMTKLVSCQMASN